MHQKKGLVFCPHFELSDNRLQIPTAQLTESQMRHFALYWDHIVQPVSHTMPKWKRTIDEIVLEEAKILIKDYQDENTQKKLITAEHRYSMSMNGTGDIDNFFGFQEKSLKKYCAQNLDVTWIPQQSFREFVTRKDNSVDNDCVQIALARKLPVPQQNISMKKIVSFKYDHRDLFSELHHSMNLITIKTCLNNNFSEAALNIAVHDLEKLIQEIAKASKYRFGTQTRLEGLKLNIGQANLASLVKDFFSGAGAVLTVGATANLESNLLFPIIGGALASASNFVQFNLVKSKRLDTLPSEQIELCYLTEAYKNKIL